MNSESPASPRRTIGRIYAALVVVAAVMMIIGGRFTPPGIQRDIGLTGLGLFIALVLVAAVAAKYRARRDPAFAKQLADSIARAPRIDWRRRILVRLEIILFALMALGVYYAVQHRLVPF